MPQGQLRSPITLLCTFHRGRRLLQIKDPCETVQKVRSIGEKRGHLERDGFLVFFTASIGAFYYPVTGCRISNLRDRYAAIRRYRQKPLFRRKAIGQDARLEFAQVVRLDEGNVRQRRRCDLGFERSKKIVKLRKESAAILAACSLLRLQERFVTNIRFVLDLVEFALHECAIASAKCRAN